MKPNERSRPLGRGLAALMGDVAAAPRATDIAIDLLEVNPFQPRLHIDPVALAELTASITASGVLQPLLVRPHPEQSGRFQIIAGERRWRAAQAAGLHEVPVLLRALDDRETMAAALVENLQRQDLNAIEEAEGYRRLMDEFAMTQEQLGTIVGKSRSHVANTLRLLNLPSSVRASVASGQLSAGHARALLSHHDPEAAATAVIAGGLNVRQTENLLTRSGQKEPRQQAPVDPETAALARDLTERLGLRVEIAFNGSNGSVRLNFATLDQLDSLITLLNG